MKIRTKTTQKSAFTFVEFLVILTILFSIAGFVVRVVYREEFHEVDKWIVDTLGFSDIWITVLLISVYSIYQFQKRKKKYSKGRRFALPQD